MSDATQISRDLRQEVATAQRFREHFRTILEDDTDLVADALEGETDLFETINAAVRQVRHDESICKAIQDEKRLLQARSERISERAKALRLLIAEGMKLAEKKTYEGPAGTVSLSQLDGELQVDEADLPQKFFRQPDPVVDRTALRKHLKDHPGKQIPGVTFGPVRFSVTIRKD